MKADMRMIQEIVTKIDEVFKGQNFVPSDIIVAFGMLTIGCMISIDIKKEEMIDYPHLSYAGAATFVCDANESSMQLFI